MNTLLKRIIKISLVFIMIMCLAVAISYNDKIKTGTNVLNVYLQDSNNNLDFQNIKEEVTTSFVAWKEKENEVVVNSELNKIYNVKIFSIYGDSSLLIKGPILFQDDIEGCLIDEDTAYKLFGSSEVVGKKIEYGERNLVVRGIHKGEKNLVVMESLLSERKEKNYFHGISMINNKKTMNFIKNNGYENTAVSNSVYYSISKTIIGIFALVILFSIFVLIIKEMKNFKDKPIIKILYGFLAIILSKVFLIITKMKLSIPVELLPNQWSDFDFWSEFYKEYSEKFRYIVYMKKYTFDRVYIDNIIGVLLFITIALVLFLIIRKYIKIDTVKKVFIATIILLVFAFLSIIIVSNKYYININNLMLWFIIPYYLFSKYLIKRISLYMKKLIVDGSQ